MACALTTGFNLDCRDSNGGIEAIWLGTYSASDSFTTASSVITAVTLSPSRTFYKWELRKQTSNFTDTITGNSENGTVFYEEMVDLFFDKTETLKRNEIMLIAKNLVYVIVKDNNGKYWWFGKTRGMELNSGSAASGTAFGDRNGYNLQFSGQEPDMAQEVAEAVIATIT